MGAPYTPKQEDTIIDEMMVEDQPLVPRVDKFLGQERWGVDTPLQVGDLSLSDAVHMGLQTAGWAEGWGSLADAADAFLYGLEGEYGEATLSGMAAIPGLGGYVAAQRYIKAAEDAGETIHKVYRGVGEWHQKEMVREGMFVPGPQKWNRLTEDTFYTTVIHKTLGGNLPFVFQPDSNVQEYAICKIDGDFQINRKASNIYNFQLKIREI